jgi:HlyD family secretion protein
VRNNPTTANNVVNYSTIIEVKNPDLKLRPGMTANVTFVLDKVENAIKIPNSALRFKPSREQMMALFEKYGRPNGRRGGSGRSRNGSGEVGASGAGASGGGMGGGGNRERPRTDAVSGASGQGMRGPGDRTPVWKLVDGKPQITFVKTGLTDGSTTQMLEGDLKPGDQLITEIQNLKTTSRRRIGAF